jgi:hypothetical protein
MITVFIGLISVCIFVVFVMSLTEFYLTRSLAKQPSVVWPIQREDIQ